MGNKSKRNRPRAVPDQQQQQPQPQGIRVDPSKVINNIQRRLSVAMTDAANWEAVAQEQGEQINALLQQVEELKEQLPEEDSDDPEESDDS